MDQRLAAFDAVLMPTTPIVAPTLAQVADLKDYAVRNTFVLRNTSIGSRFRAGVYFLASRYGLTTALIAHVFFWKQGDFPGKQGGD